MMTPMRNGRSTVTAALALFWLLCVPLPSTAETFEFSSDRTSIVFAEGRERTVLSGNARVVSDETVIEAETIEIFGEDFRYATAEGSVRVEDLERGLRLESRGLFFDREADIIRAEGAAVMEDLDNDLVVKGDVIEHRTEEEVSTVQVGVRILGEDLTARGEFARYQRDTQNLELSGLPVVFWKGDEYRASRIVMNIETEEISLQGEVRGSVTTGEETPEAAGEEPAGREPAGEENDADGGEGGDGGDGGDGE
jgi:lipopolysaccharide export system protein LptA